MLSLILITSTFIIAVFLGIIITPRIVQVARELHFYDMPDSRKVHKLPIPRLGGVAFLPSVLIAIAAVLSIASRFNVSIEELIVNGSVGHFIAYIAGASMLYILGIYDDIYGVSYKYKFVVQILAAVILCVSGLWIASFEHILRIDVIPYWIGMPFTILFVVYLTNAMNLIDGIDGLASGLSIISFSITAVLCSLAGDITWAMLAIAYIGVLAAFFSFNVFGKKNKIFMGDSGSLILGYTLSFMILHFWQANPIWNPVLHNLGIVALSTLIIPMFDVVRVMMSRLRDHRNPFLPDKNHIHHKFLRTGLSPKMTMIALLLLSCFIVLSNYIVATYMSQTLIIVLDIFLFTSVHSILNVFIHHKEQKDGIKWNRMF